MKRPYLLMLCLWSLSVHRHLHFASSFVLPHATRTRLQATFLGVARYGPQPKSPDDPTWKEEAKMEAEKRKSDFKALVEKVLITKNPDHLPSLLTKQIPLLLELRGYEGKEVVEEILDEAEKQGKEIYYEVSAVVELILSFAEEFVKGAVEMDENNKKLLGKIIRVMTNKEDGLTTREREEKFDELMEQERKNFTPGFLRHMEGECARISGAPTMTIESTRMLDVIRTIQTRVLEEIGKDMSEAARVLGQLIGYGDEGEMLGVMEAGLTVRGLDFGREMLRLTEEALEGFKRAKGVDPGLVARMKLIQKRLNKFVDENDKFQ